MDEEISWTKSGWEPVLDEETGQPRADGATRHVGGLSDDPEEILEFLYGPAPEPRKKYPSLQDLAKRDEEKLRAGGWKVDE